MGLIEALFLDIGGVLLTNGWDHRLRKKTAEKFGIEFDEMEARHQLMVDVYECGKMSFEEYVKKIIFYKKREFSSQEVWKFITTDAQAFEETIRYLKEMKQRHNLKVVAVSNEARELGLDRISRFNLGSFIDFFVISAFVHHRKPDVTIYQMAIDISQVSPARIAYIDDRALLIEAGAGLGLQGICHKNLDATAAKLEQLFYGQFPTESTIV